MRRYYHAHGCKQEGKSVNIQFQATTDPVVSLPVWDKGTVTHKAQLYRTTCTTRMAVAHCGLCCQQSELVEEPSR